jgi:cyanophycin synthetase
MTLDEIPATHGGKVGFQIENVLAAVASCWALGIDVSTIASALRSFQSNLIDNPGRFNVLESSGKTIVVTDGRNISALRALIEALDNFPHERRTVVYSAEEDRRDGDITQQGQLLGRAFDRVYLCEIEDGIERPRGEVTALLRVGVNDGQRVKEVTEIRDWSTAIDAAWGRVELGEMLVLQTNSVSATVKKLQTMLGLEPQETTSA